MDKTSMAAQYTLITLEDFHTFFRRGFRTLHPQQTKESDGEITFDLFFNDEKTVGVKVYTSIKEGGSFGRDVGKDRVKVGFFNFAKNHPMIGGKFKRFNRTQNWRDSLREAIEDYLEMYSDKDIYWDNRAT